jgi:pseudouridine-5'-phosphate glycosidase
LALQARADSAEELARILAARWRWTAMAGVLVANPIPAVDEIPASLIEGKIRDALAQAQMWGGDGKERYALLTVANSDTDRRRKPARNVALRSITPGLPRKSPSP